MKTLPVYHAGQAIAGTPYVVVGHLGSGGMGDVYEVEDVSVGRHYVLKTLNGLLARRPEYADQMRKEGRTLAKLRHPNIVEVITAGRTADAHGLPFIVMERLEGATVKAILGSVAFPFESVWQIGTELLDALYHMHHPGPKDGRGPIIHRDIKPENIFLAKNHEGRYVTKLLDLGIAILVDGEKQSVHGTPKYMAPEQLRGEVTPATDLYQVGCVLFEMLAGRHPFAGARSEGQWVDAHLAREAPRLREFVDVPKRVDEVIDAALSKEPSRRPRDARAFMVALQDLKARPQVGVLANTTVEDLHTAIEKQTETGYEAYATAENTLEGFTAPELDGNRTLEDAFPSFAVGVTVTAPGAAKAPPLELLAQVATAGAGRRGVDREAPTRSSRLEDGPTPRERDHETEELLAGLVHPVPSTRGAALRRATTNDLTGSSSRAAEGRAPSIPEAAAEARTPSAPAATPLALSPSTSRPAPRETVKRRTPAVLVAIVLVVLTASSAVVAIRAGAPLPASSPRAAVPPASAGAVVPAGDGPPAPPPPAESAPESASAGPGASANPVVSAAPVASANPVASAQPVRSGPKPWPVRAPSSSAAAPARGRTPATPPSATQGREIIDLDRDDTLWMPRRQ